MFPVWCTIVSQPANLFALLVNRSEYLFSRVGIVELVASSSDIVEQRERKGIGSYGDHVLKFEVAITTLRLYRSDTVGSESLTVQYPDLLPSSHGCLSNIIQPEMN